MAILSVADLTVAYGDQPVFSGLNFTVNKGDFLVVVGENGVGKTTLVRALLGLIKPKSGDITILVGNRVGYVPQFRNLDEEYPLSVRDFVALNSRQSHWPWLSKRERRNLDRMIKITDLSRIAHRPMGLASGGEKQRAYLAQALLPQPRLLILDESTASLDNEMKYSLLDLVRRFQQDGLSVMFITHDWELARHYGTRYLHMTRTGYETGSIDELKQLQEEVNQ